MRITLLVSALASAGGSSQNALGARPFQARAAGSGQAQLDPLDYWHEIAARCDGYPSKADCDDGDMLLFSGLLCASGDDEGCNQVRSSQGSDGRWWRSPRRISGNLGAENSFSRDMSLGALLYLAKTSDRAAAQRWLGWINNNRPCLATNPHGDCIARGAQRFCTDDKDGRCTLTPSSWALIGRVWDALGLPITQAMRSAMAVDRDVLKQSARTAPVGFELHLAAVDVFLKQTLGMDRHHYAEAITTIVGRQPDNPFFQFLAHGASDKLWDLVSALCPQRGRERPHGHQWAWERRTEDRAWEESMGWDCLFMADLLNQRTAWPASSNL